MTFKAVGSWDEHVEEIQKRIEDEVREEERLAPIAADLSDEAIAKRKFYAEMERQKALRARAHRIKRRRRKLGRNGFSTGRMAVPK